MPSSSRLRQPVPGTSTFSSMATTSKGKLRGMTTRKVGSAGSDQESNSSPKAGTELLAVPMVPYLSLFRWAAHSACHCTTMATCLPACSCFLC